MRVTALLPMKANSSRVPGKNFKTLAGKPLYGWILNTLLECEFVDKVVINTDARQNLADTGLVESNRVIICDRPPELCGDEVSMNKILDYDLQHNPAECYLMTHTTNPALSKRSITEALALYESKVAQGYDSLFSVNRYQTRFYKEDGTPINHDPDNLIPTQDLEPWFEENSCLYLFTQESFTKTGARIGKKPLLFETPLTESIDIDEMEDWYLAAAVMATEK